MPYSSLIQIDELIQLAAQRPYCLIDCRHDLAQPEAGWIAYHQSHLPHAHFLHLDKDLSGVKTGSNGRHPLPEPQILAEKLGKLGIDSETQVVVYDDQGGMFAARAWWLLRWLGHSQVAVLDGGYSAWVRAGHPVNSQLPPCNPKQFKTRLSAPTVNADYVLQQLANDYHLILDARAPDRFRGENETIDPIGGRIPGASNRFFKDNLSSDGFFKTPEQLRAEFTEVLKGKSPSQVICQCGSGVTACHNLLAMEIAGLPGATLYPGSWSEWCSNPERPTERG